MKHLRLQIGLTILLLAIARTGAAEYVNVHIDVEDSFSGKGSLFFGWGSDGAAMTVS